MFAQSNTEKFEVKGNCGMCETRIEKAAKSVDGVSIADCNQETKILEVSFDESKTSVHNDYARTPFLAKLLNVTCKAIKCRNAYPS